MTWTKEKQRLYNIQYRIDNKEKIKEKQKERYERIKNDEDFKKIKYDNQVKYRKEERQKYVILRWRSKGIIDSDFDSVYETFIKETNCWICDKEYDGKKYRKCLDHNHETGEIRYIVCNVCNIHIIG